MNQFKDVFLGAEKRDYKRAVSSQKCVRAGGKHNDLDEVGRTARHHTFFEMLGNFSFGDYFKEDAIRFAWDLLVNEWKLDPERMWFTVFEGDDEVPADEEAAALWVKVGAKPERILRFGRKDNFWQMAETGPCGPNSEINYYLGPNPEDPNFNKREYVNGPGDETVEIWNLVFMQYNRIEEAKGKYRLEPLPAPSVDTGAGLERVTAVMQGVKSAYETDLIRPIIDFTAELAGKKLRLRRQRRERLDARDRRPRALHCFPDRRRNLSGQRHARLCAAQDHAPRHLARKQAGIQGRVLRESRQLRR